LDDVEVATGDVLDRGENGVERVADRNPHPLPVDDIGRVQ